MYINIFYKFIFGFWVKCYNAEDCFIISSKAAARAMPILKYDFARRRLWPRRASKKTAKGGDNHATMCVSICCAGRRRLFYIHI